MEGEKRRERKVGGMGQMKKEEGGAERETVQNVWRERRGGQEEDR